MSAQQEAIEAEIRRTRAELARTVDELTARLDPRVQAKNVAGSAKAAVDDTRTFVTGGGLPADGSRARNVKVALGAALGVVVLAAVVVLRARR
ncbi:uncharacterized protein DUF3618 [Sediminihabitans luteus]|uniref:Uncharacterized protein DUF3618 n=1 Tax=Sediminihabitans luteus TaxID=1138585 RepID=A0A2M9D090_9CELL|nr:DUF3618 domain-containing protein [Sediminihabitans luteus]PJJ77602.1 uncharacterized protein DUF3618 [Sediminihabitans luteus]GII98502.1 hypothetical protein Slu03_08800 [Sediminihabitans luteus]